MNCTPNYPYIFQPEPANKADGKIYRVAFGRMWTSELMTKQQADAALAKAQDDKIASDTNWRHS